MSEISTNCAAINLSAAAPFSRGRTWEPGGRRTDLWNPGHQLDSKGVDWIEKVSDDRCRPRHGRHFATAALAAGYAVVATGRNSDAVAKALGEADNLLVNAANFYAGYFEELMPSRWSGSWRRASPARRTSPARFCRLCESSAPATSSRSPRARASWASSSIPPAAPPSSALRGGQRRCSPEVAPFGIHTTIVNPGFFRTELLTQARGKRYAQGSSRARYESIKSRGSIVDWIDVCMLVPDPLGTWMIRLP